MDVRRSKQTRDYLFGFPDKAVDLSAKPLTHNQSADITNHGRSCDTFSLSLLPCLLVIASLEEEEEEEAVVGMRLQILLAVTFR